jgi:integrase
MTMACITKRRGKWVVDYRDGGGVRRWRTFPTRREAEDYLSEIIPGSRQRRRSAVPANITLNVYAERWLQLIASTVKPRTVSSYAGMLRLHILPAFGAWRVQYLDKGTIKNLLADKLTHGLSKNTVRILHATLRALLGAAVDDGVIAINPAERLGRQLRLVMPKAVRQEEIKAMTREQRELFLQTAAQKAPAYFALFMTLAGTGMRLGEALALQWDDLDLETREIRVRRALSRGRIDTPKAGHGRTVDISQTLARMLRQLEQLRGAQVTTGEWSAIPSWVFCTRAGTPRDESKVRRAMRDVLRHAKLPLHFSPHCLRHSYASLMLQQGESLTYVQRQLGHASINLTADTYGKWLPMGNKAAVDRLDATSFLESGSKVVADPALLPEENSEVVEKFGGPCRGRTYGPLIKSESEGTVQAFDILGSPFFFNGLSGLGFQFSSDLFCTNPSYLYYPLTPREHSGVMKRFNLLDVGKGLTEATLGKGCHLSRRRPVR